MTTLRALGGREVSPERLDVAWRGIVRRRELRRARRRRVAGAAFVSAILLALLATFTPARLLLRPIALEGGAPLPATFEAEAPTLVALDDGSRIELSPHAKLAALPSDRGHVRLRLDRGTATFDVKPGGPRAWLIDAGVLRVRVLGTRFSVTRDGGRGAVAVERGKVAVESDAPGFATRTLEAGESAELGGALAGDAPTGLVTPRAVEAASEASSSPAPAIRADATPRLPTPSAALPPQVRAPIGGSSSGVAALPPSAGVDATRARAAVSEPSAEGLMREADEARARGEVSRAIAILERVASRAPARRSALAAFTLGKVHADDRKDPAEGARWFERAASAGLPAALAEQAAARAVEGYARAGRRSEAQRAGRRYVERFPDGPQRARVAEWMRD